MRTARRSTDPRRGRALRLVAGAVSAVILLAAACSAEDDPLDEARPAQKPVPSQTPIPLVTEAPGNWFESACVLPLDQLERVRRGVVKDRSPEIIFVPREPNFFGGFTSTTHSGPWDYVQKIPLVFYGPGFIRSQGEVSYDREVTIADLAPTLAELLDTPFPSDRPGKPLHEVLLPESERAGKPRMILTVVWDGGGWNVLETWPQSWPFLKSLMGKGSSVADVVVGSSPSVTPAVHANLGTGTFPKEHGIVDIPMRDGATIVGAYENKTPSYLEVPTLADLYDQTTGNAAKIGMLAYKSWHLGMIGHGSYMAGGDRDIAVIAEREAGELVTNPEYYDLPEYLEDVEGFEEDVRNVDLEDGKLDQKWMGHEILDDPSELRHSPAWALYQTRLMKAVLDGEGFGADAIPDLFFVNYKQVDDVGHDYNFLNPEMREILRYTDDALEELVQHLDETVGKKRWVVVMTADHGQAPDPLAAEAWPIGLGPLEDDISERFDRNNNEEDLFQDERPVGLWLDEAEMEANGVTEEEIADFLTEYRLEDNVRDGQEVPAVYERRMKELLFSAVFPSDQMGKVWHCATKEQ